MKHLIGTRVKAYKNLNNGLISIKGKDSDGKERVLGYCERITLSDASFTVGEGSRQRVIREGQKNVHAYVVGFVTDIDGLKLVGDSFTYNPYTDSTFIDRATGLPVLKASLAQVDCRGNHFYKA